MEGKKSLRFRIIRLIILLLVLTPLWSFLAWAIRPVRPLNLFILDKTVPSQKCPEHRSLNSVLIHQKFSKPDRKLYRVASDYWGFFPHTQGGDYRIKDLDSLIEARRDTLRKNSQLIPYYRKESRSNLTYQQIDSLADQLDAIYYCDLYGIFQSEWYTDSLYDPDISQVIYGGMSEKDLYLLNRMKNLNKLVITEFNTYHDPTPEVVRAAYLDAMHFHPTGWIGAYLHSLDPVANRDIPLWILRNYMRGHPGKWPFSKPGIVLINTDGRIEILEDSTHLTAPVPSIITDDAFREENGIIGRVPYPFWFDVIEPTEDCNRILSRFVLETNESGDSILRMNNIPREFPAVLASTGTTRCYYFAADFSDNPINLAPAYFAGAGWFSKLFYETDYSQRSEFFYEYYRPLMDHILNDYYLSLRQ